MSFLLLLLLGFFGFGPPLAPRATVYVFLAPTCPISQAATLELRALHRQYAATPGVAFVGVFPDTALVPADLAAFGRTYQLKFPLRADPGHVLTRRLGATITPEAAVTSAAGLLLYRGRLNDQYVRLGQRRRITQHHDLADALAAVVAGRAVAVARTEAVGCLIE